MSEVNESQTEERRDYARERVVRSEKVMDDFGDLVNRGIDSKAFQEKFCREHRTLQQSMFREILGLIVMISKDSYQTDGRNESSKEMAKDLIKGYAEILRQKEIKVLMEIGYTMEQATEKADKNVKYYLETPERYLGVPLV